MKKKIHFCKNCGKELNERHKIYCDNTCQMDYQYKQYIERWKTGSETGLSGKYGLSAHIRKYLLERADNKCELCGFQGVNQSTGNTILEVHHIDGNYLNNVESNLQILCPNCHAMTPTYRANNSNGRKDRNKYNL